MERGHHKWMCHGERIDWIHLKGREKGQRAETIYTGVIGWSKLSSPPTLTKGSGLRDRMKGEMAPRTCGWVIL